MEFLPGRSTPILPTPTYHEVFGRELHEVPAGTDVAYVALGCYWGAEKLFWQLDGVKNTAVGFMGGVTPHCTYRENCTGRTGHAETVKVVFDPEQISYADLLRVFFESHDPTQVDRQGNDVGTQYRTALFVTSPEQRATAERVRDEFQTELNKAGYGRIVTEIADAGEFYYAEKEHQQYLEKNPFGYCPVHATGVTCGPSA